MFSLYTEKFSQLLNKNILLLTQMLAVVFVFNILGCNFNKYAQEVMPRMSMNISQELLIGNENKIEADFKIDNLSDPGIVGNFKLKVSMLEQKTLTGTTTGSQIIYKDATGTHQTDSESFEKILTEFNTLFKLRSNNEPSEFKVDFELLPVNEAIKIKLNFELLNINGESIENINVEWIKSVVVISHPTKFTEKGEASFTLQNLGGDINDLSKIILNAQSLQKDVSFLIGETRKTEATLAELLPGITHLAKDEETKSIKIVLDNLHDNEETVFSILVFDTDTITGASPVTEEKVNQAKLEKDLELQEDIEKLKEMEEKKEAEEEELYRLQQEKEIVNEEINSEIKEEGKELKKETKSNFKQLEEVEEKKEAEEEELYTLQQEKEILNEKIKEVDKEIKEEDKEIKEETKSELKKLEEKQEEELRGKTEDEKKTIKQDYKRKRKEILSAAAHKAGTALNNRRKYMVGFSNALASNMFGAHLKKAKSLLHSNGQKHGHKAGTVIAGVEAAVGSGLIGVGLFAIVGTSVPTLGATLGVAIPSIVIGGVLVAHSIITISRTEANLARKDVDTFEKDTNEKDIKKDPQAAGTANPKE
jgi:hypothetical protein